MNKIQQTINQKIQGLLFALNNKDPISLQSHLEDISLIGIDAKEETIENYIQYLSRILPLQNLKKRKIMGQKLALNQKIIAIVQKGKHLINKIDEFLTYNYLELERGQKLLIQAMKQLNNFESLSSLKYQDFTKIKQQLYHQIFAKIERVQQNSDFYVQAFKKSLETNQMPLKKDQTRNQQPNREMTFDFIRALHRESSLLSFKKQLCCLVEKEDQSNGQLLQIYWITSVKACLYHFTSGSELHNLQQPGWMFEYLQQVLSSNYKYIFSMILKPLKEEIAHSISSHFLSASAYFLFMKVIEVRLKEDLEQMNPFLSFTFLQELSALEDKLFGLFGLRGGFLQTILLNHQLLLHRAFQYQNQRFEAKVFQDFININYSQINLKNLQAYNLMVAFLNLLDRLYRKYHKIKNDLLKRQIHRFYRDRIRALVSHLKTSFDRIYLHSRLPRLDILISFKRTESQLRSSLTQLTQVDSDLEDTLQKQYYGFLQQYYEACAVEALTSVHKKLHISLGDIINRLQSVDETNHEQLLSSFNKIHMQWSTKIDQICKFSRYVDNKLRTIFFTYLQGTSFSLVGLNLFLKIFEPYLQVIFNEQRHRNLISLITCSRQRYIQKLQAQADILAFLSQDQLTKLKKFKNANPNL